MFELTKYNRRKSKAISIGNTKLGLPHPIRVQSMTNTNTLDTEATVAQVIRIIEAGGEYVRITAQGVREAENIKNIKTELVKRGYNQPIIVDIHFNPKAAYEAALHADKVRINPGNFADGAAMRDVSPEEARLLVKEKFLPFIELCKKHNTAIRIGVNHGSLSERMLTQHGDTPEGMVASCMEYLKIAQDEKFEDIAISIKASNTRVMVHTVRLLASTMEEQGMRFPLHLGVTEAGDGEDGRIKSAVGIGALLCDGIGDTIRVSLSEAPEKEIPVAAQLVNISTKRENSKPLPEVDQNTYSPYHYTKVVSKAIQNIGGEHKAIILTSIPKDLNHIILDSDKAISSETIKKLQHENLVVFAQTEHPNILASHRSLALRLKANGLNNPIIFCFSSQTTSKGQYQLEAATELGGLLLDGFGDGLLLTGQLDSEFYIKTGYNILQASRVLFSKTEYISCPGCGRTLFGLENVIAEIKQHTSHLKDLKIGIMGCIVNGPGEMADADYGYVGAAKGKISLYKGQECIKKNIPQESALDELISLIKSYGDWKDIEL